jgi:hypothetical protein
MYKGIGESAYNDGLFSQAAPFQNYQGSVSQFAEGSLGALRRHGLRRTRPLRGSFQDGSLGRTFLPAFSPQAMRGLGYTYQDGVLGETVAESTACEPIRTCMSPILSNTEPMDKAMKDPFNQLVAVSIVGIVGYLIYKR